jgi:hypothetical protein
MVSADGGTECGVGAALWPLESSASLDPFAGSKLAMMGGSATAGSANGEGRLGVERRCGPGSDDCAGSDDRRNLTGEPPRDLGHVFRMTATIH